MNKYFVSCLTGFTALLFLHSCSKSADMTGIFIHHKGIQKYYILSISSKDSSGYFLKFEGVPLDNYKTTEWSKVCNGKRSGNTITCDDLTVELSPAAGTVTVNYGKNERQIFINNKKEIEEEITLYKKGTLEKKTNPGEKAQ